MKRFNYENKQYLEKLNELNESYYSKYILFVKKYLKSNSSLFLDVGCGNGFVLSKLRDEGYENGYGIDISKLFIKEARKKRIKNVSVYDGINLPFNDQKFDLIGSFNVLEHTSEPEAFIKNQISKLKFKGILIVACPNFLSSTIISPHPRVGGIVPKIRNFSLVHKKLLLGSGESFETMEPIIRKNFEYDDDAIVITNLIDVKRVLKKNGCNIVYESGFINYDNFFARLLNSIPLIRYSLPSCFVVAKKVD